MGIKLNGESIGSDTIDIFCLNQEKDIDRYRGPTRSVLFRPRKAKRDRKCQEHDIARLLKKVTKAGKPKRLSRVAVICNNQVISLFGGGTDFCAFLAAQNGTAVTLPLVLTATRAEFRELDRPINEGDFRWVETAGAGTGVQT